MKYMMKNMMSQMIQMYIIFRVTVSWIFHRHTKENHVTVHILRYICST